MGFKCRPRTRISLPIPSHFYCHTQKKSVFLVHTWLLIYFIYYSFFYTYGPMERRWRKWHRNAFYTVYLCMRMYYMEDIFPIRHLYSSSVKCERTWPFRSRTNAIMHDNKMAQTHTHTPSKRTGKIFNLNNNMKFTFSKERYTYITVNRPNRRKSQKIKKRNKKTNSHNFQQQ